MFFEFGGGDEGEGEDHAGLAGVGVGEFYEDAGGGGGTDGAEGDEVGDCGGGE